MGKKLIVKGVDYSTNGITIEWLFDLSDEDMVGSTHVTTQDVWYIIPSEITSKNLTGKTISYVKVNIPVAGSVYVGSVTNGSTWSGKSYACSQGVNVIQLSTPITLSSEVSLGVAGKGLIPLWSDGRKGWLFNKRNSSTNYAPRTIPIDFGV